MVTGRHQTYFELREALARPGCVVCRLSARSVRRYLEALSFESVNDYGIRAQLRQARGFCNLHAWQLLDEVRDPFGAGIIYRDVLNHCAGLVEAGRIEALAPERACPGCEARGQAAGRYVDVLGEHLDEPAFAEALARSGGLCWRHFALGVARGGRGLRRLASLHLDVVRAGGSIGDGVVERKVVLPTPGIRAGNAAPRPAPDEVVGDPLVAQAVGLPGVEGTAVERLSARDWGSGPLGDGPPEAGAGGAEECAVCGAARSAVDAAVRRMPGALAGPLELCAPHAWLAVERVGAEAVRARLRPGLLYLAERIQASGAEIAGAAPIGFGPFEVTLPRARRIRGDLAVRVAPGRDCAVCAAQLAAEEEAVAARPAGALCRPHLRLAGRASAATPPHWRAIVADLDEYIRKNDYRFRDEPRGPEQRSPRRAVAMAAGAVGVR